MMLRKILLTMTFVILVAVMTSYAKAKPTKFTGAKGEVKIITLDPGHFHAALIQKIMYDQVSPTVHVYGPKGPDVADHLKRIEGFNNRSENPTSWKEVTYTGDDFLEKMIAEKAGNVVVISGNNKKKTKYIKACVDAGLNVLADKPMCITPGDFKLLRKAFASAKKNGVFIYDIMTERSSITTILQKELSIDKNVFGYQQVGTVDEPAVISESVHHFFKYVAGNPIKRPNWYFDTTQQGEGIVDVTVHLTDLIMWATFPDKVIDYRKDVEILEAKRWPTLITLDQYKRVTHLNDLKAFPGFLKSDVNADGVLECYPNGSITYNLNGIVCQASVTWNYEAPKGTKDTHYALMRGSKCDLVIRQGKEQGYKPELYVEPADGQDVDQLGAALKKAVKGLQGDWAGVAVVKDGDKWHVTVPDKYRIGHEAHFGQVTERFLKYLVDGKLPEWEVPNMTAKYFTTTTALKKAGESVTGRRKKNNSSKKVEFIQGDDKINVIIGGKLFTSYMYSNELTKPVLYPVVTPSGIKVNRGFPFEEIEGEATDHHHHVGIFFTYDEVNEDGFWNNKTSLPQVQHKKVTAQKGGRGKGELSTVMNWVGKDGDVLLEEKRKMVFTAGKGQYAIDFSIDLTAQDEKVVFGDTKEGMFAIRTAQWLREKDATGHYISSNGDETAKNVWGKRARWVALEGNKDGKEVGIAILNYEPSTNYPTYWHARDYGLFAANPLGQKAFQDKLKVENPKAFALTLAPGESVHFNFQIVIYDGKKTAEQIDEMFAEIK